MIILRICLDVDIEGAEIELDSIQISLGIEIGHNTIKFCCLDVH